MPVITVTAALLDSPALESLALRRLACDVARALGLDPDDVHAVHVPSTQAATGDRQADAWPIVALHGSRRPQDRMQRAMDVARTCVLDSWGSGEAWVQWFIREPQP